MLIYSASQCWKKKQNEKKNTQKRKGNYNDTKFEMYGKEEYISK